MFLKILQLDSCFKIFPATQPKFCDGESYLEINFSLDWTDLSQVDNFSSWAFLAIEIEGAVRNTLGSEVAYGDGAPGFALSHLDN